MKLAKPHERRLRSLSPALCDQQRMSDSGVVKSTRLALALALLSGCVSAQRSLVHPEFWSEPREGVAVTKHSLRIGSETLELPSTQRRMVAILGEPDRVSALKNRILVW